MARALAVSTLLSFALVAGSATAASAAPAHLTGKTAAAQPTGGFDDGNGQSCIIVLLCN